MLKLRKLFSSKINMENGLTYPEKYKGLYSSDAFQTLFAHHPDLVVIFGTNGEFISINKLLYGYQAEDMKRPFEAFLHPNHVKESRAMFEMALKGNQINFNLVILHKDDSDIPVNATLIPITQNEIVIGMYVIIKDISQLKNQEKLVSKIQTNLNDAQRIANIGSWDYDVIEDEAYWSNQVYRIFNIEETANFVPTYDKVFEFIHPDDRERLHEAISMAMETGTSYQCEYRLILKGNLEKMVSERTDVILDENGKAIRLIGTLRDITAQKLTESRLQESKEQFQMVADNVDFTIWSVDAKTGEVVFISEGARELFGVESSVLKEDRSAWRQFVHPEDLEEVINTKVSLLSGKKVHHQYRIIDGHGQLKWVDDQTIPVMESNGDLLRIDGLLKDITEQKNYTAMLENMANHDYLTKLPNRRFFENKLQEVIDESKKINAKFGLFYIDLDRFNYINDTFGHEYGDKMLIQFAERVNATFSKNAFLARIGGDEFTLYCQDVEKLEDCTGIAETLLLALEKPFVMDEYELYMSASIGISFYPDDGVTIHELLKCADLALYKMKETGKNGWQVYNESMNVESYKLHQLEVDLRKALKRNELFLEYQPKVDSATGMVKGAEALLRWLHPKWGLVSPGEFIPIAEESGLIFSIGDWVTFHVCTQLKAWEDEGLTPVPISINISPARMLKSDFIPKLIEVFEETGVNPELVEMELTERTMIMNEELTKSVISQLHQIGVKFAFDDFGTGYSSLSYLNNFKIDVLKIDKSFIDGILHDKNTEGILKGLIYMANEIDMEVVAEGVETIEQLDFLIEKNCHQIQGYVYSKPLGSKSFRELLKDRYLKPVTFK